MIYLLHCIQDKKKLYINAENFKFSQEKISEHQSQKPLPEKGTCFHIDYLIFSVRRRVSSKLHLSCLPPAFKLKLTQLSSFSDAAPPRDVFLFPFVLLLKVHVRWSKRDTYIRKTLLENDQVCDFKKSSTNCFFGDC